VGRDFVRDLAQRIDEVTGDRQGFARVRDALPADGAARIPLVAECEVVGRDAKR
jgi:hypothetical protein